MGMSCPTCGKWGPVNNMDGGHDFVDESTRLREQLAIAVDAMEKQENWMSLKIVKANLRAALAQIREMGDV